MDSSPPLSHTGRLLRSHALDDGAHTSDLLKNSVNRGELLRIRRGCYFPTHAWLRSPPWERHLIAAAAIGVVDPAAIFCRQTALALHGAPLLHTPGAVHTRTTFNRRAGTRTGPSPTGSASHRVLARMWEDAVGVRPRGAGWMRRLQNVDAMRLQFPLTLRESLRGGLHPDSSMRYYEALTTVAPPHGRYFDPGQVQLLAESLPLAVLDTVGQSDFASAVVILDAVLAGRHRGDLDYDAQSFAPWLDCLPSGRARSRWNTALAFADALSESPGESLSRVVIAQLGFQVPTLQYEIRLHGGAHARTDFCWEDAGIVGEFDGKQKYTRSRELSGDSATDVVVEERRREHAIEQQGYRMVRWVWDELWNADRMSALLRNAGVPRA